MFHSVICQGVEPNSGRGCGHICRSQGTSACEKICAPFVPKKIGCAQPGLVLTAQEMETDIEMDKKFLQILGVRKAEMGVKRQKTNVGVGVVNRTTFHRLPWLVG